MFVQVYICKDIINDMSLCQDIINDKQRSNIFAVISPFAAMHKDPIALDEHKIENAAHIQPKYLNEIYRLILYTNTLTIHKRHLS